MFATVNGVRLFFDVLNPVLALQADALREKPVMVCLPGGPGGDHQTLRPMFDAFADVAQVIYLDPRASGRSAAGPRESWTLDQWGDDLAAFCDQLGIDRPILMGVSGGAMVVAACLARHPDRAGGAILVNPCARLDREALIHGFEQLGGPEAGAAARAMYTTAGAQDVPAFFRHCLPHYSRRPMVGPPPGAGRATFNFEVSQHFFREDGEAWRFDMRGRLSAVTVPILAISGAHDPVTRPEWASELVAALSSTICQDVAFADASHLVMVDEPDRFSETVQAFIREHCGPAAQN